MSKEPPRPATGPPPLPPRPKDSRRWDAALELIRSGDALRELARVRRSADQEKWRHDEAEKAWDRVNAGTAVRRA
jgi:hypothetical protein